MRRGLACVLVCLSLACNDASAPAPSDPYTIGIEAFGSAALGADSLRDTMVLVLSRHGAPAGRRWVRSRATAGAVLPPLGRTQAGMLPLEWRLPRPGPGGYEALTVCLATAGGECTDDALSVVTHSGP